MREAAFPRKLFTLFTVIFAGSGGLLWGYDYGVISAALNLIQKEASLSFAQLSLFATAFFGGSAIGVLIAGPLADFFGRKKIILSSSLIVGIGVLILALSHGFLPMVIGRLIQGFGIGIITLSIPLYLSEVSPPEMRGKSVFTFQLFNVLGMFLAFLIDLLLAESGSWRGMFLCILVPLVILFVASFFFVESPSWLFAKGRKDQALKSLMKTRTVNESQLETQEMAKLNEADPSPKKGRWKKFYFIPLIIVIVIACLDHLTGISIFLVYSPPILERAGLSSSLLSSFGIVSIAFILLIMTILSMFLVDRIGRKLLLSIGTAGISLSLIFTGVCEHLFSASELRGLLVLIGLIGFIVFFALSSGPLLFLLISELLPMPVRAKGMAFALFLNILVSSGLTLTYVQLVPSVGYSWIFWICAGFSVIYFMIALFVLPETKRKTLEEIELYFRNR